MEETERNEIIKSAKRKDLMLALREGFSLKISKLSCRRTSETKLKNHQEKHHDQFVYDVLRHPSVLCVRELFP